MGSLCELHLSQMLHVWYHFLSLYISLVYKTDVFCFCFCSLKICPGNILLSALSNSWLWKLITSKRKKKIWDQNNFKSIIFSSLLTHQWLCHEVCTVAVNQKGSISAFARMKLINTVSFVRVCCCWFVVGFFCLFFLMKNKCLSSSLPSFVLLNGDKKLHWSRDVYSVFL